MTRHDPHDIAVVIPARNEADRITACLTPLLAQARDRLRIIVVVNNTTDATARIAERMCAVAGTSHCVLDTTLPANQGVGTARKLGAETAFAVMPRLKYLLTTDADCIVAPDWVARNLRHLAQVDAVCGDVRPIPEEVGLLSGMDGKLAEMEGRYRALVLQFYRTYAPDPHNFRAHHGEASGASLGFRASAYASVGGFADVKCGEDRDIIRRLGQTGFAVRHTDDVLVQASLRLSGRAPGGMSDALRERTSGHIYLVDECLPPADWLWSRRNSLPVWPPEDKDYDRIPVQGLPAHIARLEQVLLEWEAPSRHLAETFSAPASDLEISLG